VKAATIVTTLALSYWVGLFVLTHIPAEQVPDTETPDKLLHFIAYFLLSGIVGTQLFITGHWDSAFIPKAVFVLILYAGFDELTQIPFGRSAEWMDWTADLAGIIAGILSLAVLSRFLQRQSQPDTTIDSDSRKGSL